MAMWFTASFLLLVALRVCGAVAALVIGLIASESLNVVVAAYVAVAVIDALFGLVFTSKRDGDPKWYRVVRILLFATFAMAGMWVTSWEPSLILVAEMSIFVGSEWWMREKKGEQVKLTDETTTKVTKNGKKDGAMPGLQKLGRPKKTPPPPPSSQKGEQTVSLADLENPSFLKKKLREATATASANMNDVDE